MQLHSNIFKRVSQLPHQHGKHLCCSTRDWHVSTFLDKPQFFFHMKILCLRDWIMKLKKKRLRIWNFYFGLFDQFCVIGKRQKKKVAMTMIYKWSCAHWQYRCLNYCDIYLCLKYCCIFAPPMWSKYSKHGRVVSMVQASIQTFVILATCWKVNESFLKYCIASGRDSKHLWQIFQHGGHFLSVWEKCFAYRITYKEQSGSNHCL